MKRLVAVAAFTLLFPGVARALTLVDFSTCVGRCDTGATLVLELDGSVIRGHMAANVFSDGALGFNIAGSEDGLTISILSDGYRLGATNDVIGPFGSFEYTIDGPASVSFPVGSRELVFTLSRTAGFSSLVDLFEANELGWWAAVHTDYQFPGEDYRAANAFRPAPPPAPVPEPASMILLGTGLLAAWRARRA